MINLYNVEGFSTKCSDGSYTHYVLVDKRGYGLSGNFSSPVRIPVPEEMKTELEDKLNIIFYEGDSQ